MNMIFFKDPIYFRITPLSVYITNNTPLLDSFEVITFIFKNFDNNVIYIHDNLLEKRNGYPSRHPIREVRGKILLTSHHVSKKNINYL